MLSIADHVEHHNPMTAANVVSHGECRSTSTLHQVLHASSHVVIYTKSRPGPNSRGARRTLQHLHKQVCLEARVGAPILGSPEVSQREPNCEDLAIIQGSGHCMHWCVNDIAQSSAFMDMRSACTLGQP